MVKNLSLEGLEFSATKIHISSHIMTITLDRPEKKNAINNVMMNELNYALAYAKQERDVRVVVIGAKGDVFCAGKGKNTCFSVRETCLIYLFLFSVKQLIFIAKWEKRKKKK